MSKLEIEASKRTVTGKKVRFLRREGKTPANVYGHGADSLPVMVDAKKMKMLLAKTGPTDLVTLKVEGDAAPTKVLVRDVQQNALTEELIHVDFYRVNMAEKIKAEVPIVFVGEPPALKIKNTILLHHINSLHIEAFPDALPHNVKVDLNILTEANQAIFVKDIQLGSGVTLLSAPEQMVAKITEQHRVEEEEKPKVAVEGAEAVEGTEGAATAEDAGKPSESKA
ncbi:MAG TPA: 50S ribosomal protein L25 [Dehalococcoidia bacterium]|nr:50S ribosomal protein L25 [Dehalococcoidia bacterium]